MKVLCNVGSLSFLCLSCGGKFSGLSDAVDNITDYLQKMFSGMDIHGSHKKAFPKLRNCLNTSLLVQSHVDFAILQ